MVWGWLDWGANDDHAVVVKGAEEFGEWSFTKDLALNSDLGEVLTFEW